MRDVLVHNLSCLRKRLDTILAKSMEDLALAPKLDGVAQGVAGSSCQQASFKTVAQRVKASFHVSLPLRRCSSL